MYKRISPAHLGRWSIGHPRLAIVLWLAFVLIAVAAGAATGSKSLQNGALGESARGYALLDRHQAGLRSASTAICTATRCAPATLRSKQLPRTSPRA